MTMSPTTEHPKTSNPTDRPRGVQIELGPEMTELVDRMKSQTLASTRAEVIRRAVSIYNLLLEEQAKDTRIELVDKDGERSRLRII